MKQFRADLHIHSRFSRATSKKLSPRYLAAWSRIKGLDVLGTGDFTHPEWLDELEEQLVLDSASGLYRLKDDRRLDHEVPEFAGTPFSGRTLFMLQGEISSIYKRGGKVRKVHNLVFMPTMEAARSFSAKLAEVGNIASDGRPILGLDSRNLLEMVLETHPLAFLVPAHIWTPWFSLFGSKSGFDSIEECFGDLSSEIFALETGLSSDPEMNWLWSHLDRFRLISNSDAHSGDNLGRECNLFSGDMSYEGIYRSLRGEALGHKFLGTLEFFPEEGKYHLDGHRKCGVVMEPGETRSRDGKCPVCGKPLTVGVLNRVLELADRQVPKQPVAQPGFASLVPLPELIGEILDVGPKTKKVMGMYARAIRTLGPELTILRDAPEEEIRKVSPLLAEGVMRMRRGEVLRQPGYDGEYGVVRVFSRKERDTFLKGATLVDLPDRHAAGIGNGAAAGLTPDEAALKTPLFASALKERQAAEDVAAVPDDELEFSFEDNDGLLPGLATVLQEAAAPKAPSIVYNEGQKQAIEAGPQPVLVMAGPGTGKTRTLVGRIMHLLDLGVSARHILALTFTRRAAREMEERLVLALGSGQATPRADTLHALGFEYWQKSYDDAPTLLSEEGARRVFSEANPDESSQRIRDAWDAINLCRERMEACTPEYRDMFVNYSTLKGSWNLADYTDLLEFWVEQVDAGVYSCPYTHVLVDEIQDLSPLQLTLIRKLVPEGGQGFFGIGDPDQSIYGFRGAHGDVLHYLQEAWPGLDIIRLTECYRSAQAVLDVAASLMAKNGAPQPLSAMRALRSDMRMFEAPSPEGEASWIGEQIRGLIGATSHSLKDAEGERLLGGELSPGDVAVLVRFKALVDPIQRTLSRLGIPCAVPENEAFWVEPRIKLILEAAGRFLGIAGRSEEEPLSCPDSMLAKGPLGVAAYLEDMPPFDRLFWKSTAFRELVRRYDELEGWAGLLNWITLQSELEQVRRRSEKVQIMTMHAAKGLEFKAVFLPALEDGIMPFAGTGVLTGKADRNEGSYDTEEERRLLYVGMTRAEQALFLSWSGKRMLYGRELRLKASRFLAVLPQDALKRSMLKAHTKRKEKQLSLMG
ncbi:UvrD-helicase domain-containing protein [Desulfovibrio mangrovi]|uniref:UvrD-helicase domain-containing protein n=1 Tax=Desulfovibrio mangrovi TaxID=2976983 RepID=UPI00224655DF|nr:UvrD-helicase domain-containing protein [Desulfovibrio mangrovi]UZP66947.1 UvrD-helicase domain-containing protein [Desulfovibrio mangrovi]